jgi:hypothetical protein
MTPNDPNQTHKQLPGTLRSGPRLPSRPVAAALIALMLGIGFAAGAAIGPAPPPPVGRPAIAQALALIAQSAARSHTTVAAQVTVAQAPAPATPPAASPPTSPAPSSAGAATSAAPSAQTTSPPAGEQSSRAGESAAGTEPEAASETPAELAPTGASKPSSSPSPSTTPTRHPPITKVWLIDLSGLTFAQAQAHPTAAPYLTGRLLPSGTLLDRYSLLGEGALANDVALLSGQAPNADTEQDCPTYAEVPSSSVNARTALAAGPGCVYPAGVLTLADQLATATLSWRAYIEDLPPASAASGVPATGPTGAQAIGATGPATATATTPAGAVGNEGAAGNKPTPVANPGAATDGAGSCPHPALAAPDTTSARGQTEPYAGFRNPFVYFGSLLSSGACAADDLGLEGLAGSLANAAQTPALSWIVPSRCDDGSAAGCTGPEAAPVAGTGAPASGAATPPAEAQTRGLARADAFLKRVVPAIEQTGAYRQHGLIIITSDSPSSELSLPGQNRMQAHAPGRRSPLTVGALLISPFVREGATVASPFNPYSLLKSLEGLFGVPTLGHAADPDTTSFGASVYRTTKPASAPRP